jgi:hypothetical protein
LSYETEREQAALKGMRIMILREIVHTRFNPRVAPAAGASIGGDVAAHFAGGAPDGARSATRVRRAVPACRRRSCGARICV